MSNQQTFNAKGDGSQDDSTLFSLSDEFLEAARVLQATPPVRVSYWSPTYYLLGHAAELLLKAFLYKHGLSIRELKKINHDLVKLASRARALGLPEKVHLTQIGYLADTYKEKSFEYRTKATNTFPCLDLLTEEIEMLQSAVFDKLCIY